jgi:hypothetical protein
MKPENLPTINARYWFAILAASMCGANTGDFAARILGLGHTRGLLPLALIFLVIVWAERRSKITTEAYYWLAIIVLRTGATNLADLGAHDLKIDYFLFMGLLVVLMVAMMLFDHMRGVLPNGVAGPDGRWHTLPATDASYWVTMLAAGTLGTAAGDWLADEAGLGFGYSSLLRLRPALRLVRLRPVRQDDEALVLADRRGRTHGRHNARRLSGEPSWLEPWVCSRPEHPACGQHDLHEPALSRHPDPMAQPPIHRAFARGVTRRVVGEFVIMLRSSPLLGHCGHYAIFGDHRICRD